MSRKLFFSAALALLVLTTGALQARPIAVQPAPAGLFEQLWHWTASALGPIFTKDGVGIDPNGKSGTVLPDDSKGPKPGARRVMKGSM